MIALNLSIIGILTILTIALVWRAVRYRWSWSPGTYANLAQTFL